MSRHSPIHIGQSRRPWGPFHWVLIVSLGANFYFFTNWTPLPEEPSGGALERGVIAAAESALGREEETEVGDEASELAVPSPTGAEPAVVEASGASVEEAAAVGVGGQGAAGTGLPEGIPEDAQFVRVVIEGPVSSAFAKALGNPAGARVALTASRLLVWNLDLNRDPRPKDTVDVLYRLVGEEKKEVEILAVRYASKKFRKSFEAYRFRPKGWAFPSYLDETGREVPARLVSAPLKDYDQITSLIGDGRGHAGMDFKAPVGTPVYTPWDGVVVRTNWNWRNNGNSVEIQTKGGRIARFLHLNALGEGIQAQAQVKAGAVIAKSGNTGRSSAPHLHYELSDSKGRVIDPLDVHETRHRRLGGDDLERFEEVKERMAEYLDRQATSG